MAKIFEIGIAENRREVIKNVDQIGVIAGKGLEGDRHFKMEGKNIGQITLIEKEIIDEFNKSLQKPIPYINFRRNIVTEGIKLNNLINKIIKLGNITIKPIELCEPCKHLEEMVNEKNVVKKFAHKGGLRCEILSTGIIYLGDAIKY